MKILQNGPNRAELNILLTKKNARKMKKYANDTGSKLSAGKTVRVHSLSVNVEPVAFHSDQSSRHFQIDSFDFLIPCNVLA